MVKSKAWNWNKEKNSYWLTPCNESYYLAAYWKKQNFHKILDFGCGLGRHTVFFAKNGYEVSAFDLSKKGVLKTQEWVAKEQLTVDIKVADMHDLSYPDNYFDAIFAYHVISHSDTLGVKKIINEIKRILKPNGEAYLTLCSKETWSFKEAGYPLLDENTVIKTDPGPEYNIPHFFVSLDDILELFKDFEIESIRHIDDCFFNGRVQNSKHYYILIRKNA